MKNGLWKFAAVCGAFVIASSAHAWIINVGGVYDGGANPTSIHGLWESSYDLFPGGFGWSVSGGYTYSTNAGSETFSDGLRTLTFDFSGTNIHAGGTQVWSGVWTATNVVGLNTATTGTYTFTFDGVHNFTETVAGQPAPEPATLGLMSIGLVGLVRRRRSRR